MRHRCFMLHPFAGAVVVQHAQLSRFDGIGL
jgi:hypothetical protein